MNQHINKENKSGIDFLIKLISLISMSHKKTFTFIQKFEQIFFLLQKLIFHFLISLFLKVKRDFHRYL